METKIKQKKSVRQNVKNPERRDGKKPLILAILFLIVVFVATQIRSISVKEKQAENNIKIERLENEIASEETRKQELTDYEEYIKTKEFIIEKARKLGLVFPDEIIFQPSKK